MKKEKFKGQCYRKLKKFCKDTTILFDDPLFPANEHSLGIPSSRLGGRVEWKRPGDICENPKLFVEKASSKDVTQGRLGNCWLVAACSALATVKPLWSLVVPEYKKQEWNDEKPEEYGGIFHFRFWRFGRWLDVVVDDKLPTIDGQLVFCHSTTANEFWSALLEKAFAKLCGSYGALDGGNLADALVDFTSGLSEIVDLKNGGYKTDEDKRNLLRKQMLRKHEEHALMCCAIAPTDSSEFEQRTRTGLVIGHAYGITAVRDINLGAAGLLSMFKSGEKLTLLRLRNPWGAREWNGAFGDGASSSPNNANNNSMLASEKFVSTSPHYAYTVEQCLAMNSRSPEWTKISKGEKEKLGLTFEDDGEFWMPFEDFVQEFTDVSICDLINTSLFTFRKTWYENTVFGEWTRPHQAGGCPNHPTFLQNPQYLFDVPRDDMELIVQLIQTDSRGSTAPESSAAYKSIGFHVMKVEANRQHKAHKEKVKTITSDYVKGRSIFYQGTLDKGRYIIIPTTFEPNFETEYMLRVFTEHPIKLSELRKDYPEPYWMCAPVCSPPACVSLITVEGASGLATSDNTYCMIKVEGQKLKSEVVYNSQTPTFNLSGVFFRYDVCKPVFVELWEKKMFRDQFLGCAVIQGAADNEMLVNKMPLVGRGSKQTDRHPGEVKITIVTYDDLNAT